MIVFTVSYFIVGLLVAYVSGVFKQYDSLPNWLYYWWAKVLDVLLFACIYTSVNRAFKKVILPVFLFSIIRFLWDVISYFTGISISNSIAISVLFFILTSIVFYLTIKEIRQWKRQRQ